MRQSPSISCDEKVFKGALKENADTRLSPSISCDDGVFRRELEGYAGSRQSNSISCDEKVFKRELEGSYIILVSTSKKGVHRTLPLKNKLILDQYVFGFKCHRIFKLFNKGVHMFACSLRKVGVRKCSKILIHQLIP